MPPNGNNGAKHGTHDLNQQAARIQGCIEAIDQLADEQARLLMNECLQSVLGLHGAGLKRILDLVSEAGPSAEKFRDALIHDSTVRGLLLIHGLHPQNMETRLREALDKVLPYIHSHGGDVELVGIEMTLRRFA